MEFLVDIHSLIYQYKLAGHDLIGEAFFRERVALLRQAEAEAVASNTEASNKLMAQYQQELKSSDHRQLDFVDNITNTIFDFFNIITKEYYLNIDRL